MKAKLIAILLFVIMVTPILASDVVNAASYSTYNITVSKSYRYVGFTPEKIYVKTNWRLPKDVSTLTSQVRVKSVTITLYEYWGGSWHKADSKTYNNRYGLSVRPISKEFDYTASVYFKSWWDRIRNRPYLKITLDLPQDRNLIHHCGFPHKIKVTIHGDAMIQKAWEWWNIKWEDFTVRGTSGKYYIRSTPYDKYRRYWGYSMSAQDYNQLMSYDEQLVQQYGEYQPSFFEEYETSDYLMIGIMIFVIVTLVGVVYYKKIKGWS